MVFIEEFSGGLEDDFENIMKVVVVGDGGVGKSSLIQRFCKGTFTGNYKKTIGVDFLERHIRAGGEDVRLMVWDTAGQEEFDTITRAYYRGAKAAIVVFSTTDRQSCSNVSRWKKKLQAECEDVEIVLVRNKVDLRTEVEMNEVDELAEELSLKVFHTSVKNDKNVEQVFTHLANTFQTRDKDLLEVEQMAGGGHPIQIADMSLGLSGAKGNDKKRKGKLKSKSSCVVL